MAASKTSQSQQTRSFMHSVLEEHLRHLASFHEELDKVSTQNMERFRDAVDEMARLTKESLDYGQKLAGEWRRLSLDAVQRASDTLHV